MSNPSGAASVSATSTGERGAAEYFGRAIRRHVALIIVSTALLTILGIIGGIRVGADYEATASALLNPLRGNPYSTEERGDDLANLDTEAQLLLTDGVIELVSAELGTDLSDDQLRNRVSVEVPTNTQVLMISFVAGNAEAARDGAQTFAESYLEYRGQRASDTIDNQLTAVETRRSTVRDAFDEAADELSGDVDDARRSYLEERIGALAAELSALETEQSTLAATDQSPGNIVSPAELPSGPSGLPVSVFAAAGGLVGLLVGVGLAVARVQTDTRLHDAARVEQLGVRTLATVPRSQRLTTTKPWLDDDSETSESGEPRPEPAPLPEAYRALRTRVISALPSPPVVIGLAGARRDISTAPEATALAMGLSTAGFEVALVDVAGEVVPGLVDETAEPTESTMPAETTNRGLADLLTGRAELPEVVRALTHNLGLLPIGADPTAARERLLSRRMRQMIDGLRLRCDYVIFAGGYADSADGQAIASLADAMLVVVSRHRTTRGELLDAVNALQRIDGSVLGAVLVDAPADDGRPRPTVQRARPDSSSADSASELDARRPTATAAPTAD